MTAPPNCSAHSTSGCHCRAPLGSSRHRLSSAGSCSHPARGQAGRRPGSSHAERRARAPQPCRTSWAPDALSRQLIPEPLHPAPRSVRPPGRSRSAGRQGACGLLARLGRERSDAPQPGAPRVLLLSFPRVSPVAPTRDGVQGGRRDKGRDTISTLRGRSPSTSFHRGPNQRETSFLGRAGAAAPGSETARAGAGGGGHRPRSPFPGPRVGSSRPWGQRGGGCRVSPAGLHLQAAPSAGPQQLGRRAPEAAYSPQRRHVAAADGGGGRAEVPPRAPGSPACAPREGRAPSAQRGRHLGSWRDRPPELGHFRVCASASRRLKWGPRRLFPPPPSVFRAGALGPRALPPGGPRGSGRGGPRWGAPR